MSSSSKSESEMNDSNSSNNDHDEINFEGSDYDESDDDEGDYKKSGCRMNNSEPINYDSRLVNVSLALKSLEIQGEFFFCGSIPQYPFPGLMINGVGEIPIPLRENDARSIISKSRNEEGPMQNNTWELKANEFQLVNPEWTMLINGILKSTTPALGISESYALDARLHRLILCEKGGAFRIHDSIEKIEGKFGTLLVVLPCQFVGGELHVQHPSRPSTQPHVWNPSTITPTSSDLKFAAFYDDCEFEVMPVTSGHCSYLQYDLVTSNCANMPRFGGNHEHYANFESALDAFFSNDDDEDVRDSRLVYILEHKYTKSGLSFEYLEKKDQLVVQCLVKYSKEQGRAFEVCLCKVKYKDDMNIYYDEDERYEDEQGPVPKRKKSVTFESQWIKYEGEDTTSEFEDTLESPWIKYEGEDTASEFEDTLDSPCLEYEVVPVGFLDSVEFDDTVDVRIGDDEYKRRKRWYNTAALVLQPITREFKLLVSSDMGEAVTKWIMLIANGSPHVELIASAIFASKREWTTKKAYFVKAIEAICTLGSVEIFFMVLRSLSRIEFQSKLAPTVQQLGWDRCLCSLVHIAAELHYRSRVNLVCSVLDGITDVSLIISLLDRVDLQPKLSSKSGPDSKYKSYDFSARYEKDITGEEYSRLLKIALLVSPEKLQELTDASDTEVLKNIIAPGVVYLATSLSAFGALPASVKAVVLSVTANLEPETSQSKHPSFSNDQVDDSCCGLCAKLKDFLASSTKRSLRLVTSETGHIRGVIEETSGNVLSTKVERLADSFAVVITKRVSAEDQVNAQDHLNQLKSMLGQLGVDTSSRSDDSDCSDDDC